MTDTKLPPTPGAMTADSLKAAVRERYGATALTVLSGGGCCGTPTHENPITGNLYGDTQTGTLPAEAVQASLGCGNPTALIELRPGQTVLDLGSGGGIDVLLSARRVGPDGKVYGLDMTDEMLALARENARKAGATNVEFLKGDIEHIPLPDASVDVIISNCVVNLAPDKAQGPARGVPGAQAGRAVRGLRYRRARGRPGPDPAERRTLDGVHRRGARGGGVQAAADRGGLCGRRRRADPGLHRGRGPGRARGDAGLRWTGWRNRWMASSRRRSSGRAKPDPEACVTLRPATAADRPRVERLLQADRLPLDGVPARPGPLHRCRDGARWRDRGGRAWSSTLTRRCFGPSWSNGPGGEVVWAAWWSRPRSTPPARAGVHDVFLLTTTAADYFPRHGFAVH